MATLEQISGKKKSCKECIFVFTLLERLLYKTDKIDVSIRNRHLATFESDVLLRVLKLTRLTESYMQKSQMKQCNAMSTNTTCWEAISFTRNQ